MIELLAYDEVLFRLINGAWQHPWLDSILPLCRHKLFWVPLYVFVVSFMLENFGKKGFYWFLFVIALVGISDFTSSKLIKKNVKRERPCQNESLRTDVHLLVSCGSGYSFTSSHASNHFTVAMFVFFTIGNIFSKIKWPFILWAGLICYAQIYVGVHYPLDVFCGALVGVFVATIGATVYSSFANLRLELFSGTG